MGKRSRARCYERSFPYAPRPSAAKAGRGPGPGLVGEFEFTTSLKRIRRHALSARRRRTTQRAAPRYDGLRGRAPLCAPRGRQGRRRRRVQPWCALRERLGRAAGRARGYQVVGEGCHKRARRSPSRTCAATRPLAFPRRRPRCGACALHRELRAACSCVCSGESGEGGQAARGAQQSACTRKSPTQCANNAPSTPVFD